MAQTVAKMQSAKKTQQELELEQTRSYFRQQLTRVFQTGDIYSPHDLTGYEAAKFKKRLMAPLMLEPKRNRGKRTDACDALKFNPILNYKVGSIVECGEPAANSTL